MRIQNHALAIGLWSENYKQLAKWYEEVLGLKVRASAELPNDSFVAFDFGDSWFWIGYHDKVQGQNKDPYRIMIEFYVENITDACNELKAKSVVFIAEPFPDPTDPEKYCMTFQDPEGNILQMYGKK